MPLWHDHLTPYNNARNHAIDRRFAQSTYPSAPKVVRGRIENIRVAQTGPVVDKKHVFHFLTNPSELSLGYNVNTSIDYTDPANSLMTDAPPLRSGLLSVSFEMLLDRSYEVWSGTLPEGVLHDIAQLERVLGMPSTAPGAGDWGSADAADRRARAGAAPQDTAPAAAGAAAMFPGVIVKRPVRIIFGGPKAFSFDGYITNLAITLMKFNAQMCPTRAGISIAAESWGDPGMDDGGTGGGASISSSSVSSTPGEWATNPFDPRVNTVRNPGLRPTPGVGR